MINRKQTFALLSERVTQTKVLNKDEALASLALRYFTSHGPATLQDFIWWSGLTINESKHALEMVKANFVTIKIQEQIYWLLNSFVFPKIEDDLVHILPAFDEFIISYKDRTASLPFENHVKTVSNNGIFRPIIVINGLVTGIWKRTILKDKVLIETELFQSISKSTKNKIEKAFMKYGDFLSKKVEVSFI